jgi:hypothetical protein
MLYQPQLVATFLAAPQDLAAFGSTCKGWNASSGEAWEQTLRIVDATWSSGYNITAGNVAKIKEELARFNIHEAFIDPRIAMATDAEPDWRAAANWSMTAPSAKVLTQLLVGHIRRCRDRVRDWSASGKDDLCSGTAQEVFDYDSFHEGLLDSAKVFRAHVDLWDRLLADGGVPGRDTDCGLQPAIISFLFVSPPGSAADECERFSGWGGSTDLRNLTLYAVAAGHITNVDACEVPFHPVGLSGHLSRVPRYPSVFLQNAFPGPESLNPKWNKARDPCLLPLDPYWGKAAQLYEDWQQMAIEDKPEARELLKGHWENDEARCWREPEPAAVSHIQEPAGLFAFLHDPMYYMLCAQIAIPMYVAVSVIAAIY